MESVGPFDKVSLTIAPPTPVEPLVAAVPVVETPVDALGGVPLVSGRARQEPENGLAAKSSRRPDAAPRLSADIAAHPLVRHASPSWQAWAARGGDARHLRTTLAVTLGLPPDGLARATNDELLSALDNVRAVHPDAVSIEAVSKAAQGRTTAKADTTSQPNDAREALLTHENAALTTLRRGAAEQSAALLAAVAAKTPQSAWSLVNPVTSLKTIAGHYDNVADITEGELARLGDVQAGATALQRIATTNRVTLSEIAGKNPRDYDALVAAAFPTLDGAGRARVMQQTRSTLANPSLEVDTSYLQTESGVMAAYVGQRSREARAYDESLKQGAWYERAIGHGSAALLDGATAATSYLDRTFAEAHAFYASPAHAGTMYARAGNLLTSLGEGVTSMYASPLAIAAPGVSDERREAAIDNAQIALLTAGVIKGSGPAVAELRASALGLKTAALGERFAGSSVGRGLSTINNLGRSTSVARAVVTEIDAATADAMVRRATFVTPTGDAALPHLMPAVGPQEQMLAVGLRPIRQVQLDGARVSLTPTFQIGDGRLGAVAFVESQGETFARALYRSNSQGQWRVLDASRPRHFGKGLAETDTALPSGVNAELHRLSETPEGAFTGLSAGGQRLLTNLATREGDDAFLEAGHRYFSRSYTEQVQPAAKPIAIVRSTVERGDGKAFLADPQSVTIAPSAMPRFNRSMGEFEYVNRKLMTLTGKGRLRGEMFDSLDGNVRYTFLRDEAGRVAPVSAEAVRAPVNSFGLRNVFHDEDGVTAPLFEYAGQVARDFGGKPGTSYISNWNYVRELPLTKAYYQAMGLPIPAADLL